MTDATDKRNNKTEGDKMNRIDKMQEQLDGLTTVVQSLVGDAIEDDVLPLYSWDDERNTDGDSIDDMKAVWERLGAKSVMNGRRNLMMNCDAPSWNAPVEHYRITAKHSDTFDPKCMNFETWAKAVLARDEICRNQHVERGSDNDVTSYFSLLNSAETGMHDGHGRNWLKFSAWHGVHEPSTFHWTAITREQYEQETAPKPDKVQVFTDGQQRWMTLPELAEALKLVTS